MKNKDEICQFVSELEQYAVECGMKKRIIDAISDVRQSIQEGISQDNLSELDQLVAYIAKQGNAQNEEIGIPREEIQQKIKAYLEQCRNSNTLIEQSDRSDCQVFIQDARREMQDYTNVDANFEDITNEGRFCEAFYRIGQKYAQQTNQRLNQYAESASSNYHNMMDNIRKMLQSSGSGKVTQRDFYQKWDSYHEIVKKGCEEKICQKNGGEEEIAGFAQEHVGEVAQIIKKQDRRRRTKKLMPLYVLLACIVLFFGGKLLWGQLTEEPQEQTVNETGGVLQSAGEVANMASSVTETVDKLADIVKFLKIAVPCMILLLIIWYLYMRGIDKQYRTWVCSSIGRHLSEELEKCWKENPLDARLDDKFRSLDDYMDKEYEKLISNTCGKILEKSEDDYRQDRLRELRVQWEMIKREEEDLRYGKTKDIK